MNIAASYVYLVAMDVLACVTCLSQQQLSNENQIASNTPNNLTYVNQDNPKRTQLGKTTYLCISELGGKCVRYYKKCPTYFPSQTATGEPYCSKSHRCCYRATTEAPSIKATTYTPTAPSPVIKACSSKGGYVIGNECVIFSEEGDELPWQDANERCLKNYGPLSSPGNPDALLDYVAKHYPYVKFWVGGYSKPNEKYFEWLNCTQIPLDPKKFPWAPYEPSGPKENQRCLLVNWKQGYSDTGCSNQHRYACTLDACGLAGGSTVGYQCMVFKEEQVTWHKAIDICAYHGGQLLVPAYPEILIKYIKRNYGTKLFWVGGVQTDPAKQDSWYWLNGERIPLGADNFPWAPGKPVDLVGNETCLALFFTGYNDARCHFSLRFICDLGIASTKNYKPIAFLIRQYPSGNYIGPNTYFPYVNDNDYLTLRSIIDPNMLMTFDIIDERWGYIRHIKSGKIISPQGWSMDPEDGTKLVLHSHRRPWALFALDQYQDRIIHHSGKFIKTDGLHIIISGDENENETMKFQFVNPYKPNKEVLPYGYADIIGDWVVVFSVLNPLASHTYSSLVTTGRSSTRSTSSTFKYGFEVENKSQSFFTVSVGGGINLGGILTVGGDGETGESEENTETNSMEKELVESSSETWSSEQTREISFTVEAGQSVTVWQRVFIATKHDHRAVHLSNIFADTNSSRINPKYAKGYQQRRYV